MKTITRDEFYSLRKTEKFLQLGRYGWGWSDQQLRLIEKAKAADDWQVYKITGSIRNDADVGYCFISKNVPYDVTYGKNRYVGEGIYLSVSEGLLNSFIREYVIDKDAVWAQFDEDDLVEISPG